jgi:uncharacterized protein (TIGR02246 family)
VTVLLEAGAATRRKSSLASTAALRFHGIMQRDEQAIRELVAEWHNAAAAGDLSKILRLMAEDVIFYVPGQAPMRGKEPFAAAFRSAIQQFRIDSSAKIEEIHIAGSFAHLATHLTVAITPLGGGPVLRRSGYTLSIMRKEADNRWVLYRDANMLTP